MSGPDLELYESAFREIDAPALIVDTDLVVRDVNEAGLAFTGYDYDELVGQPATVISGDLETYAEIVETIAEEAWSGDYELRTKEGAIVYGSGSVAPLIVDGWRRGYVAIFIDTTKQRRYENAAEVLNRILRHDLRNDLNVATGSLESARARIDDEETLDLLETAEAALGRVSAESDRAHDLVDHLEGSSEAENRPVRLDYALDEALIDATRSFEGVRFASSAVPSLRVVADHLLAPVFTAVLENTVEQSDRERPAVEVSVEEREASVLVTVADVGPEGTMDRGDRVLDHEGAELHQGSGIGLFFADSVIESYGGEIRVGTGPDGAAIVEVRLRTAEGP
ncbi:PAS domain-containing sensor histidine kinase [Halalkalicoccus tibetensis]|uniref:histidine kinase n=1 Tax=Halalkalicoccus tibetensis TaxID=175632 RepID=A0ABD5V0Z1_9EURY